MQKTLKGEGRRPKASIAFKATPQVRNKLWSAYQEITNQQLYESR